MGNNFTISVNLQRLKNAGLVTISGKTGKKRCVCIPVDDNPEIFVGEKGIYLGMVAIERKEVGEHNETHIVKGNLPKEVRDAMSEEERKRPADNRDSARHRAGRTADGGGRGPAFLSHEAGE